jgi:hypothetical protein
MWMEEDTRWREVRLLMQMPDQRAVSVGRGMRNVKVRWEGRRALIHPKVNVEKKRVKLRVECNASDCS